MAHIYWGESYPVIKSVQSLVLILHNAWDQTLVTLVDTTDNTESMVFSNKISIQKVT